MSAALPDTAVRAFVALPCPPRLRGAVAEAVARGRRAARSVRWSDPERVHLTLRFLGRAEPAPLTALDARLTRTAAGAAPLSLEPAGLGAFPSLERPRVLWLGFADAEPIERLAEAIEADARAAGFEPDERPFTAHLTLGRVRGEGGRAAVRALVDWEPSTGQERVDAMVLYRSDLGPGGARHSALESYPLGGGA